MRYLLQYFLVLAWIIKTPAEYTIDLEQTLRDDIFEGYNLYIRPTKQVSVSVALNLISVITIDISEQKFSFAGYFSVKWKDGRLRWDNNETYSDDIRSIFSNQEVIWRPLLILENSVNDISVFSDEQIPMRINKHGIVHWHPSGVFETYCECDVTYFPFDIQTCQIVLTTWGYTSFEIDLLPDKNDIRLTYYKNNGEWTLLRHSSYLDTNLREDESIQELVFSLTFRRRPHFHMINSIFPMILLALLGTLIFKVPPKSGEKIGYTLTVMLSYTVYLTLVAETMPSSSKTTSIVSVYLLGIMVEGVISVFVTVFVLHCHLSDISEPVPAYLKRLVYLIDKLNCQCTTCSSKRKKRHVDPVGHTDGSGEALDNTSGIQPIKLKRINDQFGFDSGTHTDTEEGEIVSWHDVGNAVDSFCFKFVLAIVVIFSVLLLIVLGVAYNTV